MRKTNLGQGQGQIRVWLGPRSKGKGEQGKGRTEARADTKEYTSVHARTYLYKCMYFLPIL